MFKKWRKEKAAEPEELLFYKGNQNVDKLEPKRSFKRNLTVSLGLLFVLIYVLSTLYANDTAKWEALIFRPGVVKAAAVVHDEQAETQQVVVQKNSTSGIWQGYYPRVLKLGDNIQLRIDEIGGGLSVNEAATLIQIESCGHKHATSPSGAIGLGQVMPFHWGDKLEENPKDWPHRPYINLPKSFTIFRECKKDAGGDLRLAYACYNGGPGRIDQKQAEWPAETQRYVYWAMGIMNDIAKGLETSPTLEEWMNEGGAHMCNKDFQKEIRIELFGE